jgi:hypothetical protein
MTLILGIPSSLDKCLGIQFFHGNGRLTDVAFPKQPQFFDDTMKMINSMNFFIFFSKSKISAAIYFNA